MECIQCGPIRHRKSSYCPFCGRGLQVASVRSASGKALVSSWPVAPLSDDDHGSPGGDDVFVTSTEPARETADVGALRLGTATEVVGLGTSAADRQVMQTPSVPIRLPGPVDRPQILPAWVVVLMVVLLLAVAAGYIFTG